MADNAQKTPLVQSLHAFTHAQVQNQIALTGRAIPCVVTAVNGSLVTVSFQLTAQQGQTPITLPSVTIPIIGSQYIRIPIQVGDAGMTVAADYQLGGVTGLGGGVATTARPTNLSALAFVPLGNVGFFSVNGQILTMYGPGGVTLMDEGKTTEFNLTPGKIVMSAGGHSITISSAGVVIDGITFGTHEHTNGNNGGPTGAPIAGS
jgi:hypothetical protein